MNSHFFDLNEAQAYIQKKTDTAMTIAGHESLLKKLPKGNWIGATSSYFMTDDGGIKSNEKLMITTFDEAISSSVHVFEGKEAGDVYSLNISNGFAFILIPAKSKSHGEFSLRTPEHDEFAKFPLIGWIAGTDLDELENESPKVIDGSNGQIYENAALVLSVELPESKYALIDIINIFEQDPDSPTIEFVKDGFSAKEAIINGKEVNFAEYLRTSAIDTKFPLVSDLCGAHINKSFLSVDEETVKFYAHVFTKMTYKFSKPIENYSEEFLKKVTEDNKSVFSCNCILNYLYSDLRGKKTKNFKGPITFGEIGYILLNQTLVYLMIDDKE